MTKTPDDVTTAIQKLDASDQGTHILNKDYAIKY